MAGKTSAGERAQGHGETPRSRVELVLVGANHRTCPLDIRETLHRRITYPRLKRAGGASPPWEDLVLLRTCNRVEVYALTRSRGSLTRVIRNAFGLPANSSYLYVLEGVDAAAHLFRVADGQDSLAQGERQVAEQVRLAPAVRPRSWQCDGSLTPLFERAARVAPRLRVLAEIDGEETSASHAAVRFIEGAVPVRDPAVAFLGSGKMVRLAARALRKRAGLTVVDRDPIKARKAANELGGSSADLGELDSILARVDVVIAATSSRKPIVSAGALRKALERRGGRALWMVDLGVPRNIDPRARDLVGITLVDIDGLQPWAARLPSPEALSRVESRVREEAESFVRRLRSSDEDAVAAFRRRAEAFRKREVERALARLPESSEAERRVIEKLTQRLVNGLLHAPTERLRTFQSEGRSNVVREILEGWQGLGGGSA